MTTKQIKQQIKRELEIQRIPTNPTNLSAVWHCFMDNHDIENDIDDAIETAFSQE